MRAAKDLDAEIEQFIRARQQRLIGVAYLLTQEIHEARDLVQDALVKAYRRWRRTGMPAHPEAFVRRIVVREFLSSRRRRSASEEVLPAEELPDNTRSPTDPTEDRLAMWSALADLPDRQRTVLVLRAYADLHDASIAEPLDCATGTVRSLAARAYAQLRQHPTLLDLIGHGERSSDERP